MLKKGGERSEWKIIKKGGEKEKEKPMYLKEKKKEERIKTDENTRQNN